MIINFVIFMLLFLIKKEHADIEWKFSRSRLFMEFIKEGSTLPIPFNLITAPLGLVGLVKKIIKLIKKDDNDDDYDDENDDDDLKMKTGVLIYLIFN